MKLEDLQSGKLYKCSLSGLKTLVIKKTEKVKHEKTKKETEVEVVSGKFAMNLEDGTCNYFYNELFDGQLEELNK